LLDVEVWNEVKGATADEIRDEGIMRAERKAAEKFATLPQDSSGMVVEFCFVVGDRFEQIANNQHIFSTFPLSGTERCVGGIFLVCGIGDATGQIQGYRFVDPGSPRPLLLRAAK
jgi:hypothetical protein